MNLNLNRIDQVRLPLDPLADYDEDDPRTQTPLARTFHAPIGCAVYLAVRVNEAVVSAVGRCNRKGLCRAALELTRRLKRDTDALWRPSVHAAPDRPTWHGLFAEVMAKHDVFPGGVAAGGLEALADLLHDYLAEQRTYAYTWPEITPERPYNRRNRRIIWRQEDLTDYIFRPDGVVTDLQGVPIGEWDPTRQGLGARA